MQLAFFSSDGFLYHVYRTDFFGKDIRTNTPRFSKSALSINHNALRGKSNHTDALIGWKWALSAINVLNQSCPRLRSGTRGGGKEGEGREGTLPHPPPPCAATQASPAPTGVPRLVISSAAYIWCLCDRLLISRPPAKQLVSLLLFLFLGGCCFFCFFLRGGRGRDADWLTRRPEWRGQ